MADQKYNVEIQLTLGQQSKQSLKEEIDRLKKEAAEKIAPQSGGITPEVSKALMSEFDAIEKRVTELAAAQEKAWEGGEKSSKEYTDAVEKSKDSVDELYASVQKLNKIEEEYEAKVQATLEYAQTLNERAQVLRKSAENLEKVSRLALVGGTAIFGGIFAAASKYVAEAEEATEVTVQWKAAQEDLKESSQRIGAVFAKEALPFLRQGADFIKKAADFIEANPEIVPAAIKAGAILIAIGTIGKIASTGIRLVADATTIYASTTRMNASIMDSATAVKFLEAAGIQSVAADKQLAASKGGLVSGGKAGAGGFLAVLADAAVLLGSFAAGLIVADRAFDKIENRDVKFEDYITTIKQTIAIDAKNLGDFLHKITTTVSGNSLVDEGAGMRWFEKVAESLGLLKEKADDAANSLDKVDLGSVGSSPARDQILSAYENYLDDIKGMEQKFVEDRKQITSNALKDELDANKKYASSVSKVNSDLASSLSKLASDFAKANAEAEANYNEQRNDVLQQQADDILRIQTNLKENLDKMERDSAERQSELIADRDALGLAKEQRRIKMESQEAIREAGREVAERRAETSKRLEELRSSYEQERAERLAEYNARVLEARQQAAERLEELRAQHNEEIARIRQQRIERLKELEMQLRAERERRTQYFLAQVRDLDATLLGERNLRIKRQNEMIADLDKWFATYRTRWSAGLNSLASATPQKDSGGYVNRGLYRMAWDGNREFVLSGPTTKAAEKALGSQLSQENILKMLSSANNTQANYYDQRRMEVPLTKDQKKLYQQAAVEALKTVIGA